MKRVCVLGALALLLTAVGAPRAWSFDWKDVAAMHQDSISDELILEKIQHSGKSFDLDARDLHELKAAGVSDRVITAMLRTEDQGDEGEDGSYRYAHPYYPYSYSPWYGYYPGTRVNLGFSFGRGYGYRSYYGGHGGYRGNYGGGHYGGGRGGWGHGSRGGGGGYHGGRR